MSLQTRLDFVDEGDVKQNQNVVMNYEEILTEAELGKLEDEFGHLKSKLFLVSVNV